MDDDYANAVYQLEQDIDMACNRVLGALTAAEIASELRRAADEWANS